MHVSLQRDKVKRVYNTPNWHEKVDKMTDTQVVAIYIRLKNLNKIV